MNLKELQQRIYEVNKANGWFDPEKPREITDDVALIHSEISEAFEAFRSHGMADTTATLCEISEEDEHLCKPEGVGSELADVLVRMLDTATRTGIDGEVFNELEENLYTDEDFTLSLPFIASNSFGTAITALHLFTSGIVADNPSPSRDEIEVSLSKLYKIFRAITVAYNVPLFEEVDRKIKYNATRGYRHGDKLV